MRWADIQLRSSEISTTAEELFRWWLGELSTLIPGRLRDLLWARQKTLILDVLTDRVIIGLRDETRYRILDSIALSELDSAHGKEVIEKLPGFAKGKVVARLPADRVFRKIIELPIAARGQLRAILGHEIERQTPLDADQADYDYRILARDVAAEMLKIELIVIKKDVADYVMNVAKTLGLVIAAFGIVDDLATAPLYTFSRATAERSSRTIEPRLARTLGIMAAVLALGLVAATWWRDYRERSSLQEQVAQYRAQAEAATRLRQQIAATQKHLQFLEQQKQQPLLLDVIREVTITLPDDTWLAELTAEGPEVRLQGTTPAAAGLIGLFDRSSLLANARFSAPVTQIPSGSLEHFDISVDIKQKAAP